MKWIILNYFIIGNSTSFVKNSKWADDSNAFQIVLLVFVLFWTIVFFIILCEPGARLTAQFEMLSIEVSRYDWYLLPIGMQGMYIIFLSDTQNPMQILCYGNITCDRDTTKKVQNLQIHIFQFQLL